MPLPGRYTFQIYEKVARLRHNLLRQDQYVTVDQFQPVSRNCIDNNSCQIIGRGNHWNATQRLKGQRLRHLVLLRGAGFTHNTNARAVDLVIHIHENEHRS